MTTPQHPAPQYPDPQTPQYQAPQYPSQPPQYQAPQYPPPAQYQAPQYPSQPAAGVKSEPPLWAPWYGIPLPKALERVLHKYATFSGRASRAEFWWWTLLNTIVFVLLNMVIQSGVERSSYGSSSGSINLLGFIGIFLLFIWWLAALIPTMALTVRRLHDVNMSGWLVLIGLIPFVGGAVLLIMALLPPNSKGQRFDLPTVPPTGSSYGS